VLSVSAQSKSSDPASARALVTRFAELMQQQQPSRFDEVIRPDYIQHNPMIAQGIEGLRAGCAQFFMVFPDLSVNVERIVVEGDIVVGYFTWSGTHSAPSMGLAPTKKRATWTSMDIWRIQDGKLAEHWDVVDWASIERQLKAAK
jgi:predicted ester cyclase